MSRRILIIGGSPCSGKSTIAEMIVRDHDAYYYKVDDFLDKYINKAVEDGKEICRKYRGLTPEEMWMEDPAIHCREEFMIYEEISPYVFEGLDQIDHELIVTEGAAFIPAVMKKYGEKDYITMISTPDFQVSHYKERKWVSFVLEGCSDKQQAFRNWMERDILFAEQVKEECEKSGVPCIVNDGSRTVEEIYAVVKKLFDLK